jgi:hypothetical protein
MGLQLLQFLTGFFLITSFHVQGYYIGEGCKRYPTGRNKYTDLSPDIKRAMEEVVSLARLGKEKLGTWTQPDPMDDSIPQLFPGGRFKQFDTASSTYATSAFEAY